MFFLLAILLGSWVFNAFHVYKITGRVWPDPLINKYVTIEIDGKAVKACIDRGTAVLPDGSRTEIPEDATVTTISDFSLLPHVIGLFFLAMMSLVLVFMVFIDDNNVIGKRLDKLFGV